MIKNKRILISSGPTWVPIDKVRVISNMASGKTGALAAQRLHSLGAKVTLLMGPGECFSIDKKIRVIRFKFFDELLNIIKKEVGSRKFDAVIHSAAVSDYKPLVKYQGKIGSGKPSWRLDLVPAPKIIDQIKKMDRSVFCVGFKYEPAGKKDFIIKKARLLLKRANLDLVVANSVNKNGYIAYIVGDRTVGPLASKIVMINKLVKCLGEKL